MSPSFKFTLGNQVDDGAGRWVCGSIASGVDEYEFTADLMRRHSSGVLQCHTVRLAIERPFRAEDFAAYLRLIGRADFETVTHDLRLYEAQGLEPAAAAAIFDAVTHWVQPWDHECLTLLETLATLGTQLEDIRKRESLSIAFARFRARER